MSKHVNAENLKKYEGNTLLIYRPFFIFPSPPLYRLWDRIFPSSPLYGGFGTLKNSQLFLSIEALGLRIVPTFPSLKRLFRSLPLSGGIGT